MLVKHGADPSIVDVQGFNALHLAAQFGFPLVCAYLISSEPGVDVDSTDPEGQTALMWARRLRTPVHPPALCSGCLIGGLLQAHPLGALCRSTAGTFLRTCWC